MDSKQNSQPTTKFKKSYTIWLLTGNAILTVFFTSMLIRLILIITTFCSESPSSCGYSQFIGTISSIFVIFPLICFLALFILSIVLLRHHLDIRKAHCILILLLSLPFAFLPLTTTQLIFSDILIEDFNNTSGVQLTDTLLSIGSVIVHLYFISLLILSIIHLKKLSN